MVMSNRRRLRVELGLLFVAIVTAIGPLAPVHAALFHDHAPVGVGCEHDHRAPSVCSDTPESFHADCSVCLSMSRTEGGRSDSEICVRTDCTCAAVDEVPESVLPLRRATPAAARAPPLSR